jgi:hypothetical protein
LVIFRTSGVSQFKKLGRQNLVRVHRVYINDKIEGTSLNKHTLKAAAGEA